MLIGAVLLLPGVKFRKIIFKGLRIPSFKDPLPHFANGQVINMDTNYLTQDNYLQFGMMMNICYSHLGR